MYSNIVTILYHTCRV